MTWVGPSTDLGRKLLVTFGVRAFANRGASSISKSQVQRAIEVPIFSPILRTARYDKLEKLATAKHIPRGKRMPSNIRGRIQELSREGFSAHMIAEKITDESSHSDVRSYPKMGPTSDDGHYELLVKYVLERDANYAKL